VIGGRSWRPGGVNGTPLTMLLDLVAAACWIGIVVLAFFVAARLIRPDVNIFLIWSSAYTFWFYMPAYPVVAFAAATRRWPLLAVAGIVVVFHLAWILPDYAGADDIPAEAADAPHIRVMTVNVYIKNPDPGPTIQEIIDADPDLLMVQEFGPGLGEALDAAGAAERYPHRKISLETPFLGLAMYSKYPLTSEEVIRASGRQFFRVGIEVEGVAITVLAVHPTSPGSGGEFLAELWNEDWAAILDVVESVEGPLIIAGDFNMTQHHRWHRELKDEGLTSAHEARGRGNATTWQQGSILRPIRLDHVFTSKELVALDVREGKGSGSDHRPVIADFALLPDR